MIVTMLARLEGQNTSGTPWYAAGQKWAMDAGISDGTNMTGAITREQLAAILFRYAKQKGCDVSKSVELNGFADANMVSSYATDAMRWAVANGLIQGSNSKLNPKGAANTGAGCDHPHALHGTVRKVRCKIRYLKPNIV